MAKPNKKNKLRPSILDRLMDDNPSQQTETDGGQQQALKNLRRSVRRDLENLLNTRLRVIDPGDEYPQLKLSILNYGLPDLATVNVADLKKKQEFVEQLENLLLEFEPRFKSVTVNYQENSDSLDRSLRFRIDAVLYADPTPETVVFDSVLEPLTRSVNVAEARHG